MEAYSQYLGKLRELKIDKFLEKNNISVEEFFLNHLCIKYRKGKKNEVIQVLKKLNNNSINLKFYNLIKENLNN
jgi:hypothetical protein